MTKPSTIIDDIEEFIVIDKRIDTAEDQAADSLRESIRDRWEFGRLMLAERKGKQLPKGVLDELAGATGKSRRELKYRAQFAERYPTENEVGMALPTFNSWSQVKKKLPKPPPPEPKPPKPTPVPTPKPAEATGTAGQPVEAEAINWDSLPPKAREREAVMRRVIEKQVRRELEAEFEPRVQAEVGARVEWARKRIAKDEANARRVLDTREGIMTKADYKLIRACLHPDTTAGGGVSEEKRAEAFDMWNRLEIVFLNEKERPTRASNLPSSTDELIKRRRERRGR